LYICTTQKTLKIKIDMEAQKNTKKYWIYCFAWLAIMIALIIFKREFFWLALPGTGTYFAKAMDIF